MDGSREVHEKDGKSYSEGNGQGAGSDQVYNRHRDCGGDEVSSHQVSGLRKGGFRGAEKENRRCAEGADKEGVSGHAGDEHYGKNGYRAAYGAPEGILERKRLIGCLPCLLHFAGQPGKSLFQWGDLPFAKDAVPFSPGRSDSMESGIQSLLLHTLPDRKSQETCACRLRKSQAGVESAEGRNGGLKKYLVRNRASFGTWRGRFPVHPTTVWAGLI